MDLFTYLMSKNEKNLSIHGDLFSYLLGKGQSQTYTVSGVTIYIPDAKKLVSFMMTKESTQDGEPTPNNPVEVNVVEGYRNLFDKSTENVGKFISSSNGSLVSVSAWNTSEYIEVNSNLKYILSAYEVANSQFAFGEYTSNQTFINRIDSTGDRKSFILNLNPNTKYIRVCYRNDKVSKEIQLTEGDQELPYVPYGNNYVNVAVSDGTNTNNYPIPLNNNIIAGIGDYKDELKVDKSGNVSIEKNTAKIDSYNGETITTPYMSTTGGLDTGATVYYGIDIPETIDLQTTVDIKLFKGVNNISNSEDGYMTIEYQ